MAAPKQQMAAHQPMLSEDPDGTLRAVWPLWCFRFLFSDGRTVDVLADRDDSDLRGVVLKQMGAERIEGVARLMVQP